MDFGYVIKGKLLGDAWRSEIYNDAEDCDSEYLRLIEDDDYSELKQYITYIHYEEIQ